jgi:hypothetical protein
MALFGVTDPQGLENVIFTYKQYIESLIRLPFTAIGEEFFKLLIFLSFFGLLPSVSRHIRIFMAVLLAAFVFGHLHIFGYELTAGVPIMFGAIAGFYLALYYRSIIPLIIEHFIADLFAYTAHTQIGELFEMFLVLAFLVTWLVWSFRDSIKKKDKPKIIH